VNNIMAYRRIKGIPGLVFVPDSSKSEKKHSCKDCFFCQWCSDSRCDTCLNNKKCQKRKKNKKQ